MKNTFGNNLQLTLFGESHGPMIGAVLDGLAPGMEVDEKKIEAFLLRRRPSGETETARRERDAFQIASGVLNGRTTGTPLCILIPNENTVSRDYVYGPARPSQADYAAFMKYHGFEDYRGGGHFSGRITAALCAAGGILIPALQKKGILLGTHILQIGTVCDRRFEEPDKEVGLLEKKAFPVLNAALEEAMLQEILKAKEEGDSVGGLTETAVTGLPAGLGEPWFDSVESLLAHGLYSIGGVKGIEFGEGFSFASLRGSAANDAFILKDGKIGTETNRSGGINGGITNGMPLLFRCAFRPTASIGKTQRTVDFIKNEETEITVSGRHDPAYIRRVCPVIDSMTALVLADLLTGRYGTDFFFPGGVSCSTD